MPADDIAAAPFESADAAPAPAGVSAAPLRLRAPGLGWSLGALFVAAWLAAPAGLAAAAGVSALAGGAAPAADTLADAFITLGALNAVIALVFGGLAIAIGGRRPSGRLGVALGGALVGVFAPFVIGAGAALTLYLGAPGELGAAASLAGLIGATGAVLGAPTGFAAGLIVSAIAYTRSEP